MNARQIKGKSFFDVYPQEYDDLTDAQGRLENHSREIQVLVSTFKPTSVLDAGCATGLTSRLFARHGIRTVGLDRSKALLHIAASKHRYDSRLLAFNYGHFERLRKGLYGRFDLVVCLANSIGGVSTIPNLHQTLGNFYSALKPGGHIVIQMLNFGAVKEGQITPVRATRKGEIVYQRFSERQSSRLYLYITRLDIGAQPPSFEIFRHQMDNFSPDELLLAAKNAGFTDIKQYANLLLSEKFAATSRDLVITARR